MSGQAMSVEPRTPSSGEQSARLSPDDPDQTARRTGASAAPQTCSSGMLPPVPRTFLIDTDTASDDAVALIMVLRAPDVRVAAITVVAGNVELQQATRNALYTVELCGADVPVYSGVEKPLLRVYENATWFHGRDGLGDHNYPAPKKAAAGLHAVDAII